MTNRTSRTPVHCATGDVCPNGLTVGLGAGVSGIAMRARGRNLQRWTNPSMFPAINLKAFAASPYQGADP